MSIALSEDLVLSLELLLGRIEGLLSPYFGGRDDASAVEAWRKIAPEFHAAQRALEQARSLKEIQLLRAAAALAEQHYALPRCKHGNALKDHAGEFLEPTCGCKYQSGRPR